MAAGVDKSKIPAWNKSRTGYSIKPKYRRDNYWPPSERQIAFLKDLYRKLKIKGIETEYNKRALVNSDICRAEIRRAFLTANRNGINFKEVY